MLVNVITVTKRKSKESDKALFDSRHSLSFSNKTLHLALVLSSLQKDRAQQREQPVTSKTLG